MSDLSAGTVLNGKYRVERVLGKGGMGFVLEAFHLDLECRVAVKILHAELRTNKDLVERFLREGKCAARISNEHVAKVFDVDRLEDGTPFLVMEYLVGHDLSVVRKKKQPLSRAEAIDYLLQACAAISEAHAQGIIHRDIKPANLFLTRGRTGKPTIKLLDFGISKISASDPVSEVGSTKSSVVMGSAEYMSPEQMLSTRDADHRTDIWALGIVLFELLTAQVPFTGETLTQVCMKLMSEPPARLTAVRPDLDEDLERVVMRCLEKERNQRYATVDELASALEACRAAPDRAALGATVAPATQPLPLLPPVAAPSNPVGSNPAVSTPDPRQSQVPAQPTHAWPAPSMNQGAPNQGAPNHGPQHLAPPAHQVHAAPYQPAPIQSAPWHQAAPLHGPPPHATPHGAPPQQAAQVHGAQPALLSNSSPAMSPPMMLPGAGATTGSHGSSAVAASTTNPSWGATSGGASPSPRSSRVPMIIGLVMVVAVGVTVGITRPWETKTSASAAPSAAAPSAVVSTPPTAPIQADVAAPAESSAGTEPASPPPSETPVDSTPSAETSARTTPSAEPPVAVNNPAQPQRLPTHVTQPTTPTAAATPAATPTASTKTPRTMY